MGRIVAVIVVVLVGFAFVSRAAFGEKESKEGRSAVIRTNAPATFSILENGSRKKTSEAIAVVYLHGRHAKVSNGCPWMRPGASKIGLLACPEGGEEDVNDTRSWGDDIFDQAKIVNDSLASLRAKGASKEPGVAVGFSQGSFVAVDLLRGRLVKFRGLVLLGADVHPDAKNLKERGVRRVVFGAGQKDGTYEALQAEATKLAAEGIETRFVDLGDIGHSYMTPNKDALRDAIAWAGSR